MPATESTLSAAELGALFVAHFNAGDIAAVEQLLAEDAVWTLHGTLPASGVWRGRRAIIDDFLAVGGALFAPGSPQFEILTSTSQDNRCLLELHATGTARSGKPYDNYYVLAFEVGDHGVVSINEYMDSETWRSTLCE